MWEQDAPRGISPEPLGNIRRFPGSDFPGIAIAASTASKASQRSFKWLARVELGLLILISALLMLQSWSSVTSRVPLRSLQFAVAVALAAAILVKFAGWMMRSDLDWITNRAIAETAKSESWRYMMHVSPYDGDEAAAQAAFQNELRSLITQNQGFSREMHRLSADQRQITGLMRTIRELDFAERRDIYETARVLHQLDWYSANSRKNHSRARTWLILSFAILFLALVLAMLPMIKDDLPIIKFVVTLAIAATALNHWSQYQEMEARYGNAAGQASLLRESLALVEDQHALAGVVREIEAVFGAEHAAWQSRQR